MEETENSLPELEMPIATTLDNRTQVWEELRQQFPERREWQQETIYSLPTQLIDAIVEMAPGLLSEDDEEFERTLTKKGGMGFFMKVPFYSEILRDPDAEVNESQSVIDNRIQLASENIQALLTDEMLLNQRSELSAQAFFEREKSYEQRAGERRRAYAVWLITNPDFQISRMVFQKKWGSKIRDNKKMPEFQKMKMLAPDTITEDNNDFFTEYMAFFEKWGLDTLTTWQLPLPLHANPVGYSRYSEDHLPNACLTINIPWYLLADQDLKLKDIAQHNLSFGDKDYLRGWLIPNKEMEKWGYSRLAVMLEIYVYLIRGLYCRYPTQLIGKKAQVDKAFASFYYSNEKPEVVFSARDESIRKIRQELERRLKGACDSIRQKLCPVEISED